MTGRIMPSLQGRMSSIHFNWKQCADAGLAVVFQSRFHL